MCTAKCHQQSSPFILFSPLRHCAPCLLAPLPHHTVPRTAHRQVPCRSPYSPRTIPPAEPTCSLQAGPWRAPKHPPSRPCAPPQLTPPPLQGSPTQPPPASGHPPVPPSPTAPIPSPQRPPRHLPAPTEPFPPPAQPPVPPASVEPPPSPNSPQPHRAKQPHGAGWRRDLPAPPPPPHARRGKRRSGRGRGVPAAAGERGAAAGSSPPPRPRQGLSGGHMTAAGHGPSRRGPAGLCAGLRAAGGAAPAGGERAPRGRVRPVPAAPPLPCVCVGGGVVVGGRGCVGGVAARPPPLLRSPRPPPPARAGRGWVGGSRSPCQSGEGRRGGEGGAGREGERREKAKQTLLRWSHFAVTHLADPPAAGMRAQRCLGGRDGRPPGRPVVSLMNKRR